MTRCVVVGSGAREHALAWALAKSAEVVVTPGNPGIAAHGLACTAALPDDLEADLFVVGPEQPLVEGLADTLRAQGKTVFGPGADGAILEGSKAFMKTFLEGAGVPTAAYGVFSDVEEADAYLASMSPPYVVKTDGLAAGKGVLVTEDLEEARADVRRKLSGNVFGGAGRTVVIEECLVGDECSLHVLCDGRRTLALATAQDYKRVGEGDRGANTGGMGAYAPMTWLAEEIVEEIMARVIDPTLAELRQRDVDYRGVLYAGMMLTASGPKLLEYNVRFGDPETEVLAPLYGASLYGLLDACARGTLDQAGAAAHGAAVTVVLASEGYPGEHRVGDVIRGLGDDGQLDAPLDGVVVFHAGTARDELGRFVTRGGRVLAVTGLGDDLVEARERAYEGAARITFAGSVRRGDIAGFLERP
jgi:phosphoribosylamine--glycine ligase